MNDLKNKLTSLNETKELIRAAIADREVEVPDGTPFREYAGKVRQIPLGGAAALNIAYGDTAPEDTSKLWVKGDAPKVVIIRKTPLPSSIVAEIAFGKNHGRRKNHNAVALGRKIYTFGGADGSSEYSTVLKFNVDTGESEQLACTTKQTTFVNAAAAAVDGKIYILGGYYCAQSVTGSSYPVSNITVFDPVTETTKSGGSLVQGGYRMGCAAVGKKIYLVGGIRGTYTSNGSQAYIEVYNTETGDITTLGVYYPEAVYGVSCAAIGEKIYMFGGHGKTTGALNWCYVLDVSGEEGPALQKLDIPFPVKSNSIESVAIGEFIYCFVGSSAYRFDPDAETFEKLDILMTNLDNGTYAVTATGNECFIVGGQTATSSSYSEDTINKYTIVEPELSEKTLLLAMDSTGQQVELVNMANLKMTMGLRGVYRGNSEGIAEKAEAYLWGIRDILHGYEAAAQVSSATELTAEIQTEAGQLVVAAIAARDSFTVSNGWTLLSTSEVNSTDTTGQRLAFAYKTATGNSATITVTQASENRLYINLVALTGATGVTDNGYTYQDSADSNQITVTKPAGLTLWACSAPLWGSVLPYAQWEADNDPYRIDLGDRVQSRLALLLDQSEAESVIFTAGASSTMIIGCLTVEGMAEFYEGDGSGWCEI